jgi:hypothetical protein
MEPYILEVKGAMEIASTPKSKVALGPVIVNGIGFLTF